MRRAFVEIKYYGKYNSYHINFNNEKHYNAWFEKISRNGKVLGIRFHDGKDVWDNENYFDAYNADKTWEKIKGTNE